MYDTCVRQRAESEVWKVCHRVGMLFLPKDEALADLAKKVIEDVVEKEGHCHVVGWRDVPVVHEVVGRMARDAEPRIVQVHLSAGPESVLSISFLMLAVRRHSPWASFRVMENSQMLTSTDCTESGGPVSEVVEV